MPGDVQGGLEVDLEEAAAIQAAPFSSGVDLPAGAAAAMACHARMVRDAADRMNLTGIVDPAAMLTRHILDSLLALRIWPEMARCPGLAMDLGSGAGYPGLPLALAGAAGRVVLLDATRRKVEFLARAAGATGARAEARWGRAEGLAGGVPACERVWVRAVAALPVLVELAFGILAADGVVLCWKGPEALGSEAAAGDAACRALGGQCLGMRAYSLPAGAGERTLFAYRRGRGSLPRGVPRSPSVIRRHPLAVS